MPKKIPLYDWWHKWYSKRTSERFIDVESPVPVILVNTMGSAGQALFGTSATAGPMVTEANASNILTQVGNIAGYTSATAIVSTHPTFINPTGTGGSMTYMHPLRFQTTLTATAGGEIVAANVGPPTLAGYQSCMLLTHVFSDQTDAGIAFTIAPSAGAFTSGLTGMTIATVANTVSPDYNQGLSWKCATDAATIQFACAAGQAGNAQNVTFCGVYWYET